VIQASGEEKDMFKARAQAFLPPGFGVNFTDLFGAQYDLLNTTAATSSQTQLLTGRVNAGKAQMLASGAAGLYANTIVSQVPASSGQMVSDLGLDAWYIGSASVINAAPTGNAELGFAGLLNAAAAFGSTDVGSTQYIAIGVSLPISATNYVVRHWDGTTTRSFVTSIPFELNILRRIEMCNDGMGSIWVLRDGVITDQITDLNFLTFIPHNIGSIFNYVRAQGGTASLYWDWFGACVSRT
jgi:hypothetical protein